MARRYMNLESKLCRELEMLEEKYRNGHEMSEGDLRKIDLLAHAMKCLATFVAMRESDYQEEQYIDASRMGNNSYMNNSYMNYNRGMDGRYTSRDMDPNMSGHYPMYPQERRW